jgi:hypothetical protein
MRLLARAVTLSSEFTRITRKLHAINDRISVVMAAILASLGPAAISQADFSPL